MKNFKGAMESALNRKAGATPPAANPGAAMAMPQKAQEGAFPGMQQANGLPSFEEIVEELQQLILEGKLPPDFDLQEACTDPAFSELIVKFPAEAALRVYIAERQASRADETAMQRMHTQVRSRNALPRSTRGGTMSAPTPNYRDMDDATFRRLLAEMKKTARNGGKTRL